MQIVSSTVIVFLLVVLLMLRWRKDGVVLFLATAPLGMMAAINLPAVGGTTIIAIDLAVLGLLTVLLLLPRGLPVALSTIGPGSPGFLLLCFLVLAVFTTLFFPRVFAGDIDVFSIGRVDGQKKIISRPLQPGTGNLSQLLRMFLSFFGFVALATYALRRPDPALILRGVKVATALHVGLGVVDILTNAANVEWLMSVFRTANYSLTLGQKMAGLNRMIGGFPEASAYGYLTLGLFGFWTSYFVRTRGTETHAGLWLALITFALLRGTSSSAYVAAAGFVILFVLIRAIRVRSPRLPTRSVLIFAVALALVPFGAAASYALYQLVPGFTDFIDRSLLNKLTSTSGVERMSWNVQAWSNVVDTHFLGAGLGSVRASNWLLSTLGTTGLIGTLLYVAFVLRVFAMPHAHLPRASADLVVAFKFGCVGFLIRAIITKATPNLEIVFFAFAGLAVGLVLAHARSERRVDRTRIGPAWRRA